MYTRVVYTWIVKNITLSADEKVIAAARKKARAANRTLNEEFRRWREAYAAGDERAAEADAVMEQISAYAGTDGRLLRRHAARTGR